MNSNWTFNSSYNRNSARVFHDLDSKISVHKRKYIQRLALSFSGHNFSSVEFRMLIELLAKSFPSTRYLYLNFTYAITRNRTDQDLIWLGLHITKCMPNLKHFAIQFEENNLITSEGLKIFYRQIAKRCKRLESLSLDFSKCEKIESFCLKSLTKYMSTCLRNLKNLRIRAPIDSWKDMKNISFPKRTLNKLEHLDLCLNPAEEPKMLEKFQKDIRKLGLFLDFDSRPPISLDQIASSYLKPLENLRSLNLHLPSMNLYGGTQQIIETLNSKIKTLDHLKILFTTCFEVMQAFLTFLQCPQENQLKKLELGFDSLDENSVIQMLPVESFSTFSTNFLQHLKNLTYLDLKLQTVHIQDLQVKNLAACIAKDLPKLEFFNIFFFLCPAITDESVKAFQEDFCAENTLPNLQTLILSFSNCHKITKKPIKSLRSALKKRNPAIESATVNFVDYQDDPNYCSSDDEDNEMARQMTAGWGPKWKAIKIHPDADPEDESNWRIFARVALEADSSYYESDGSEVEEDQEMSEKVKE